jgi:hypothetical protein
MVSRYRQLIGNGNGAFTSEAIERRSHLSFSASPTNALQSNGLKPYLLAKFQLRSHDAFPRVPSVLIVELGIQLVWHRRDDRKAAHPLARRRAPRLSQARQSHQLLVSQRDRIGLPPSRDPLPFMEHRAQTGRRGGV